MTKMRKSQKITVGIVILGIGILLLGVDRIFVAADNASYAQSMTYVTVIALLFFLVGAIWFFWNAFR